MNRELQGRVYMRCNSSTVAVLLINQIQILKVVAAIMMISMNEQN